MVVLLASLKFNFEKLAHTLTGLYSYTNFFAFIVAREDSASRCICCCQILKFVGYDKVFDLGRGDLVQNIQNKIRLKRIFKWIGVTTQVNSFSKYANFQIW